MESIEHDINDSAYIMRNFTALLRLTHCLNDEVVIFPSLDGYAFDDGKVYFDISRPKTRKITEWTEKTTKEVIRICCILTNLKIRAVSVDSSDFELDEKNGAVVFISPEKLIFDVDIFYNSQVEDFVNVCIKSQTTPVASKTLQVIFEEKNNPKLNYRSLINLLNIKYQFYRIKFPESKHLLEPTISFYMMRISKTYRIMNLVYQFNQKFNHSELADIAGSLLFNKKIDINLVMDYIATMFDSKNSGFTFIP